MKIISGILGSGPRGNMLNKLWVATLSFVLLLLVSGCGRGAYPIELFTEMHYTQSQRAGEPDRLSPPASSIPWQGMGF